MGIVSLMASVLFGYQSQDGQSQTLWTVSAFFTAETSGGRISVPGLSCSVRSRISSGTWLVQGHHCRSHNWGPGCLWCSQHHHHRHRAPLETIRPVSVDAWTPSWARSTPTHGPTDLSGTDQGSRLESASGFPWFWQWGSPSSGRPGPGWSELWGHKRRSSGAKQTEVRQKERDQTDKWRFVGAHAQDCLFSSLYSSSSYFSSSCFLLFLLLLFLILFLSDLLIFIPI